MTSRRLTADDVVGAAAELADEVGPADLSLSGVAKRLGVSQPAMYRHVEGFDDLQRRVAIMVRIELRDRLLEAAAGRSGPEALRAMASAWRSYVLDHSGRYAITDRIPLAEDEEAVAAVSGVLVVIQRVVESCGVESKRATGQAWAIRAALHGFAVLEVGGGHPSDMDHHEVFGLLVDALVSGVAVTPG